MNYQEAEVIVQHAGLYSSPDFYRMQTSLSIALGLRDDPVRILSDVVQHGTADAKALLQYAIQCGYVHEIEFDGHKYLDVVDIENAGAMYQFRSHIAMQIAYPALYWEFFEGEHVWTYSHPKMQALVVLTVSCLSNKAHPSDYYGEHEIGTKPKRGRKPKEKEPVKDNSTGEWQLACRKHNQEIHDLWVRYQLACKERKDAEVQGKAWREQQLNILREQMKAISAQYNEGMRYYDVKVLQAQELHRMAKLRQKPQRNQFE